MYAEVHHTEKLSPDLLRVVLTGGTLDQFDGADATDSYINARFPPPESPVTVPFSQEDLADIPDEFRPGQDGSQSVNKSDGLRHCETVRCLKRYLAPQCPQR